MSSPDDTTTRISTDERDVVGFLYNLRSRAASGWFQGLALFTLAEGAGGYNFVGEVPSFPTLAEIDLAKSFSIRAIEAESALAGILGTVGSSLLDEGFCSPKRMIEHLQRFAELPTEINQSVLSLLDFAMREAPESRIVSVLAIVGRGKEGLVMRGYAGDVDHNNLLGQLALAQVELCSVALVQKQQAMQAQSHIYRPG